MLPGIHLFGISQGHLVVVGCNQILQTEKMVN